jgi:hypothetical protein
MLAENKHGIPSLYDFLGDLLLTFDRLLIINQSPMLNTTCSYHGTPNKNPVGRYLPTGLNESSDAVSLL